MIVKLEECTPEFVRKCFPEQSGDIFVGKYSIFMIIGKNNVLCFDIDCFNWNVSLVTSAGDVKWVFGLEPCERRWWRKNGTKVLQDFTSNGKMLKAKVWDESGKLVSDEEKK